MLSDCGIEKALESPLDCKIKPVTPKENKPWILIGKTDVKLKLLCFGHLMWKSWLTGKDSDAGKDWWQEKWVTEDEMVGWNHWLKGHEFEKTLGNSEGQGRHAAVHRVANSWTGLRDWTPTTTRNCWFKKDNLTLFSVFLKEGNESSMWKMSSLHWEVERHPYPPTTRSSGREVYVDKLTTSLLTYSV